mmetsp:Transcript_19510/g.17279  ORF Transcript_19510/g.17279 Transcript_19510/m.17279 type:complete len:103 (+) Transcript_19510:98-406(+)
MLPGKAVELVKKRGKKAESPKSKPFIDRVQKGSNSKYTLRQRYFKKPSKIKLIKTNRNQYKKSYLNSPLTKSSQDSPIILSREKHKIKVNRDIVEDFGNKHF